MVTPPPIQLASLGMENSIILMVLALVVFGPRRLPQIGRQIGKLMYEFRKASNDFKFQMEEELRASEEAERRKKEEAERQRIAVLAAESQASVSAPAQSVEAVADIGAVEPATVSSSDSGTTYSEQYSAESSASSSELAETPPIVQPPLTGEQVSASSPFTAAEAVAPEATEQAVSEVNPDADAAANAEGLAAGSDPALGGADCQSPAQSTLNSETTVLPGVSPTPPKETVSQHG